MKKLVLLLIASFSLTGVQADTYYNCATPSSTNASDLSNGSTCTVAIGTWNVSGNTLIVRSGSTYAPSANLTLACNLTIEAGGILLLNNGRDITVSSTSTLIVNGTIVTNQNNQDLTVNASGNLIVGATGVINMSVGNNGGILINGLATISGSVSEDNGIVINSNITISDNASFFGPISGTATAITLKRNFNRTGWHQLNFPVTAASAKTLGDLASTGGLTLTYSALPTATVYVWTTTATTASWELPTSGLALADQPLEVYVGSVPATVSLSVTPAQINAAVLGAKSYIHSVPPPNTTPPGNGVGWTNETYTDGWVMRANPFQSFLSSDLLGLTGNLDNAVYVWNGGPNYVTRAGGIGAAEFISPNQSFFVHCTADGSYQVPLAARNFNPSAKPNYFKTGNQVVLSLSGDGHNITSYIAENPSSTPEFDGAFDAHYLYPTTNFPTFNSVGVDSTTYSVNQVPDLTENVLYLSFYYEQDNKNFTISMNQAMANNVNFVVLEDIYEQTLTDLKSGDYTFVSNTVAPPQRFKLHFTQSSIGLAEFENESNTKIWISGNELRFDENANLDGAIINVYTINGQLVSSGTTANPIFVNQSGVYVINIIAKTGETSNVKVVKM